MNLHLVFIFYSVYLKFIFASPFDKSDESDENFGEEAKKLLKIFDTSGFETNLLKPQTYENRGKKCLVLDLDETLIYATNQQSAKVDLVVQIEKGDGTGEVFFVNKRPGVDEFLAKMIDLFEVVIFTAGLKYYADSIIDFLEEELSEKLNRKVELKLRLYRDSCLFIDDFYIKDLSRLGRPLDKTLIIDNYAESFALQPDNGIHIKTWQGELDDRELENLHDPLVLFAQSKNVAEWKARLTSI